MQLTPNKKLIEILHEIPRGIPSDVVKYAYVYVVLKKNNWNRTKTARELKVTPRAIRHAILRLRDFGFDVQNLKIGRPVKNISI